MQIRFVGFRKKVYTSLSWAAFSYQLLFLCPYNHPISSHTITQKQILISHFPGTIFQIWEYIYERLNIIYLNFEIPLGTYFWWNDYILEILTSSRRLPIFFRSSEVSILLMALTTSSSYKHSTGKTETKLRTVWCSKNFFVLPCILGALWVVLILLISTVLIYEWAERLVYIIEEALLC